MTISIWRYSHFTLAISSSIFILLATVTGIVLAFEPISNQLKPYAITNADDIKLSEVITVLQDEYDEIVSVESTSESPSMSSAQTVSTWIYSITFPALIAFVIAIFLYLISRASRRKTT